MKIICAILSCLSIVGGLMLPFIYGWAIRNDDRDEEDKSNSHKP